MNKIKMTFSEKVLNRISEVTTVVQNSKYDLKYINEDNMELSMRVCDIVDAYARIIEHGLKNFHGKFTWDEIFYMFEAIRGVAFCDSDVSSTAYNFIIDIDEYEEYYLDDDDEESGINTEELIKKLKEGSEFNQYSLLAFLNQTLLNIKNIPDCRSYLQQYLGLKD